MGIDAANNELYCRPEVFAQAFRYLKDFFGDYYDYETFQTKALKSIGFTFHAGEDFYDIADGKIRYDGININKIKKDDLRKSLGIRTLHSIGAKYRIVLFKT